MPRRASVSLVNGLTFRAETERGHTFTLDAGPPVGGSDAGPSPMEALLVVLASCAAMDVISILRKMRQDVSDYSVAAEGTQADEHPRRYTAIALRHTFAGAGVGESNVRRAIWLSMARYCPVFAMLSPGVAIGETFVIENHEGSGPLAGEVLLTDFDA